MYKNLNHCRRGFAGTRPPAPGAHVAADWTLMLISQENSSPSIRFLRRSWAYDHAQVTFDRASPPDVALQARYAWRRSRDRYGERVVHYLGEGSGHLRYDQGRFSACGTNAKTDVRPEGMAQVALPLKTLATLSFCATGSCAPGAGREYNRTRTSALADELHHRWRRIQRCWDRRGTGRLFCTRV